MGGCAGPQAGCSVSLLKLAAVPLGDAGSHKMFVIHMPFQRLNPGLQLCPSVVDMWQNEWPDVSTF